MPPLSFYSRAGAQLGDFNLEDVPDSILTKLGRGALGVLGTVGRVADYPARVIRRALTGLEEPTGHDILGIQNEPGFDITDIPAFVAQMALDPMTYIGGIFGLNKFGRAAKALEKSKTALTAAEINLAHKTATGIPEEIAKATAKHARTLEDIGQAENILKGTGMPSKLAPTWGEQAAQGQRQLLEVGFPFTSYKVPINRGAGLIGVAGKLGEAVAATRPYQALGKAFNYKFGQLEKTEPIRMFFDELRREAPVVAKENFAAWSKNMETIGQKLGIAPDEIRSIIGHVAEKPFGEVPGFGTIPEAALKPAEELRKFGEAGLKKEQLAGLQIGRLATSTGENIEPADLGLFTAAPPKVQPMFQPAGTVEDVFGGIPAAQPVAPAQLEALLGKEPEPLFATGMQVERKYPPEPKGRGSAEEQLATMFGRGAEQAYAAGPRIAETPAIGTRPDYLFGTGTEPVFPGGPEVGRGAAGQRISQKVMAGPQGEYFFGKEPEPLIAAGPRVEGLAGPKAKYNLVPEPKSEYIFHPVAPEGRKWLAERSKQEGGLFRNIRETGTTYGPQKQRKEFMTFETDEDIAQGVDVLAQRGDKVANTIKVQLKGESAREANRAIEAAGGPKKFFVEDPALAMAYRGQISDLKIANALQGQALVKRFAGPTVTDGPTLKEFREASGIDFVLKPGEEMYRLPQDVADEFLKTQRFATNPESINLVQKAAEGIRHYVSQSLLLMFPSFHARNLTTNAANTAIQGLFHPVNYTRDWVDAFKKIWQGSPEATKWQTEGIVGTGFATEVSGDAFQRTIQEGILTGPPSLKQKLALPTTTPGVGKFFRTGQRFGEAVEGASRVAHYKAARRAGMDHLSAMESVEKALFDYTKLTPFEKKNLRPYLLFFTWNRKQIEMLMREFPKHTGELAAISRLTTQPTTERGPMPTWLRSTTALPAGKDVEGNALYWSGFGLPLEVLQNLDIMNYGVGQRVGSQLNPAYKIPMELLSGQDLRMDQPIEEMTKAYRGFPYNLLPGYKESTTKQGYPRTTANPWWLYALRNSPLSRFATETGQAMDPTKDVLTRVLNTMTGAKISSIDENAERRRQAIAAIEGKLKALAVEGKAALSRTYFATGEVKDPEVKALLRLEAAIKKSR